MGCSFLNYCTNRKCICNLCAKKADECPWSGCKDCDKVTGHLGCMNKPDWADGELHVDLYARSLRRKQGFE